MLALLSLALALSAQSPSAPRDTAGPRAAAPRPPPRSPDDLDATHATDRTLDPDVSATLRLVLGPEWDTNARRAVSGSAATTTNARFPTVVVGDAVMRALVDADVSIRLTHADRVNLGVLVGAKRFYNESTEDVLVADAGGDSFHALGDTLGVYTRGRFRASRMRSRLRDYTLGSGGGGLSLSALGPLTVSLGGRYDVFDFGFDRALSYQGPAGELDLTLRPTPRLSLSLFGGPVLRAYDGYAFVIRANAGGGTDAILCDGTNAACPATKRSDTDVQVGGRFQYRGPFVVGLDALVRLQFSTSELERIDRYRVAAYVTTPLPLGVHGSLMAALQFNKGVSASQALYLVEDDENQNSVEVQLSRAIDGPVRAALRYGLYTNEFATAPAQFVRQTVYLGLSYEP